MRYIRISAIRVDLICHINNIYGTVLNSIKAISDREHLFDSSFCVTTNCHTKRAFAFDINRSFAHGLFRFNSDKSGCIDEIHFAHA